MQLDQDWLTAQGVDAALLQFISIAFLDGYPKDFGVAVSGGGDSMALLHLAHRFSQHVGIQLHAVTIDHQLRAQSALEAAMVADVCAQLSVPHDVIRWDKADVAGNLSAAARDARYALIAGWAQQMQIADVLLGHTKNDQAENFLMALTRSAGIDGLSAMARRFRTGHVTFARPLLNTNRQDLRDYLVRFGIGWVDDPTNEDDKYLRARMRKAMPVLNALGISEDNLLEVSVHARSTRAALEHQVVMAAEDHATFDRGDLVIKRAHQGRSMFPEIERRLTRKIVQWVGQAPYPPRQSSLDHAMTELRANTSVTIGGCILTPDVHTWRITREHNAVKDTVADTRDLWDERWQLDGPHAPDLQIRALGEGILDCPDWRETGMPRISLLASPAIWRGNTLISAPLAGYNDQWTARIVADFHSYLLAH